MARLSYSCEELLALSPRTLHRCDGIDAWGDALKARGHALIDPLQALLSKHYAFDRLEADEAA